MKRVAAYAAVLFIAAMGLLSNPAVSHVLVDSLQVYPALDMAEIAALSSGPPAAIVIISAGRRTYAPEFGGATVDALSLERIRYGAALARQTHLPVLVSGGAAAPEESSIATLMGDTLKRDYGVTPKWLETRASNTAENAIFSAQVLNGSGIKRVVLVTHAWHMKRARAAFAANGLTVVTAPTAFYRETNPSSWGDLMPSMQALRMSGYAIQEIAGIAWYALHYGY